MHYDSVLASRTSATLARLLESMGRTEDAKAAYWRAIEILRAVRRQCSRYSDDYGDRARDLVRFLEAQGQTDEAADERD